MIEDDEDLRANLLLSLHGRGFPAWGVPSAEAFYRECVAESADIVLVDLGLPGEDGLSVVQHLRNAGKFGLIVITARGAVDARIAGLEAGADYYFVKPIDLRELAAAIDVLWRRQLRTNLGLESKASPLTWSLRDVDMSLVLADGRVMALAEREWRLMDCLLATPGAVVSKAALYAAMFPDSDEVDLHRVDVILSRLRQKLISRFGLSIPIRTIFGKGYVLAMPL